MRHVVPLAVALALTVAARAADDPSAASAPGDTAVATWGNQVVTLADVERGVKIALKGAQASPESLPLIQGQILEQIIERRLMLAYLAAQGLAATDAELDQQVADVKDQLQRKGQTFEQFLAEKHSTEANVREELAYKMGTHKLLTTRLTDEFLRKYFDDHRQQFDGSELRVSHILWRIEGIDRVEAQNRLLATAAAVREQIVAGSLTFEDAAARFSAGPSRRAGGDLGFIPRHGAFDEIFASAAFDLKPGEISPPILTNYGVHLIKCVDAKPGTRSWQEAKNELRGICGNDLLDSILKDELAKAKITFTGASPYFVPGTKKLIVPPKQTTAQAG